MSFRVEGQDFGSVIAKIEGDLRFLYKCCESSPEGTFEVVASAVSVDELDTTGTWVAQIGGAALDTMFISFDFTSADDVNFGVYVNGTQEGSLIVPAGSNTAEVTFATAIQIAQGDTVYVQVESGAAEMVTVQLLMRGEYCGSGGLNFVPPEYKKTGSG